MSLIQKHGQNMDGRDFIVGDIHGQYDLLLEAMARVDFDKAKDRLFCVGDLIDRGADSFKCLSLAFEPWFFGVRGNHEMLAIDALERGGSAEDLWMINGGTWAITENMIEVRQILREALKYLPYARQVEVSGQQVGIVHAEPPADWSQVEMADDVGKEEMVWGRTRIKTRDTTPVSGIDAVVVGHTILEQPTWLGNVFYIDTGAFQTGRLTLINAREVLA
ncbi:metallophosphoesterase [Vreelandella arcis]|uniref:Serine/threonine protein phosphatase 1 n=1 Tax=Vreelandella arcis TaxID=416873 RepID=A0A1G9YSN3_9GAMM|nr:metallophosphoesterase [Halomonas arcis]SDN11947.1 serine/threonine protein phosphatase 1 [Halomonas arcis]